MIPKTIHQIWIGDKKMPKTWMRTWQDKNPDYNYKLWTDNDIKSLLSNSVNLPIYKKFLNIRIYHGAADVARVEILKKLWRCLC